MKYYNWDLILKLSPVRLKIYEFVQNFNNKILFPLYLLGESEWFVRLINFNPSRRGIIRDFSLFHLSLFSDFAFSVTSIIINQMRRRNLFVSIQRVFSFDKT